MISVRDVLRRKGSEVWSIEPDALVLDALRIMAEKEIGALVVLERGTPIGIFSERDYARKVILHGRSSRETRVAEVMSAQVVAVEPQHAIESCMTVMTERRVRHLPVIEEGRLVGLVSIGDVVKAMISEKDSVISQLESYIVTGR